MLDNTQHEHNTPPGIGPHLQKLISINNTSFEKKKKKGWVRKKESRCPANRSSLKLSHSNLLKSSGNHSDDL